MTLRSRRAGRLTLGVGVIVSSLFVTKATNLAAGSEVDASAVTESRALRRDNQLLASRVAKLEEDLARLSTPGGTAPTRVQAPFEVIDAAGNLLFRVTGDPSDSYAKKARVTIARASGDNFVLTVRNAASIPVSSIGQGKAGSGVVATLDAEGNYHAGLVGDRGMVIYGHENKEIANFGPDPDNAARALLWVDGALKTVDGAGKPVFTVTDATAPEAAFGRVHVGRGAADNFAVWIRGRDGKFAAAMGEGKAGGGLVTVADASGRKRADLFGQGGLTIFSPTGKEVVSLDLKAGNTEAGTLELRGLFQLFDAAGETMVEAGTSPAGVGVVRVGPGAKCVPLANLRVPDCIMGHR